MWLNSDVAIRQAVLEKARSYGPLDLPYIIAVDALLDHVDDVDVANAFFGTEIGVVSMQPDGEPGPLRMTRRPDGAWATADGPRYTRTSGVLLGVGVTPWTLERTALCLYHNPWAARPYRSPLTRLRQAKLAREYADVAAAYLPETCFTLTEGEPLTGLLDLQTPWP